MTDRPKKLNALWRRFSQCDRQQSPPVDAPPPIPSYVVTAADVNTTIVMIDGQLPKSSRRKLCAPASESPPSDPEMLSLDDVEIAAVDDSIGNDADSAQPVGDLPISSHAQQRSTPAAAAQPDREHRQTTFAPISPKTTPDYGSFFDGRVRGVDRRSYRSNLRINTQDDCEGTTEASGRSGHQLPRFADDDDSLSDAVFQRMERERRRRRAHSTHFEMRTPDDHLLKSGSSETESICRPLGRQTLHRDGLSRSMPKLVQSMRISRQPTERRRATCAPRPAQSWLHLPQMAASSNCSGFVHAMNNFPPGQHQSSRHPMHGPARNIFAYTTMQPVRQTTQKYRQIPDWQDQAPYGYQPPSSQITHRVQRQESVSASDNVAAYASQRNRQLQADVFQDSAADPEYYQQFSQPMPVQQTPVFVIPSVAGPPTMNIVGQAQWSAGYGAAAGESSSAESSTSDGRTRRKSATGRNCMLGWMLAVTAVIILALAIALFVQGCMRRS